MFVFTVTYHKFVSYMYNHTEQHCKKLFDEAHQDYYCNNGIIR